MKFKQLITGIMLGAAFGLVAGPAKADAHQPSLDKMRSRAYANVLDYAYAKPGVSVVSSPNNPTLDLYNDGVLFHSWGDHGRCAKAALDVRYNGKRGWIHLETCRNADTGYERQIHWPSIV